jgi:ABC-2 type transport system permease protein
MTDLGNTLAIARREYLVRARTRSFVLGTALLVFAVVVFAFMPVAMRYFDRTQTQTVGVWIGATDLTSDPVARLQALLNAPTGQVADPGKPTEYTVTRVADLESARREVVEGKLDAVLAIQRGAGGDLEFTLYSDDAGAARTGLLATSAIAVDDRLNRLGVQPGDQAALFAPPQFSVAAPDPAETGAAPDAAQQGADYLLGFGLSVLIFMLIILYGNWIAMSVVEEKSSRVMEVILNAATPFQLLTGKVLGVGGVAMTQYAALLAAGAIALVAQAPVASVVLGESGGQISLPAGLTVGILLLLGVFTVLGFLLYGVLYAAAGSLVSRQEDVQAAVMPLTLVSTVAYLVAVYSATGLVDINGGALLILALVPFVSPFLMLTLISSGQAGPAEAVLAIVLLAVAIVVALWVAARIYEAGVLLYGQRPGIRSIWRMARTGS